MASSSTFLSEDELQCSICLDVFTDPVSTPCGHNFCMICIKIYWDTSSHCQCPLCKMYFTRRPELRVNTFISGLASSLRNPVKSINTQYWVLCDICSKTKREALKSCLICMASYCKIHLEPHERIPLLKKHKLINPVRNPQDYICQKHEKPLEMFCRDDQTYVCPICTKENHKNHKTVPIEEESRMKKTELLRHQAEVEQMVQNRLKKIHEIKHSFKVYKKVMEATKSFEIFYSLLNVMRWNKTAVKYQSEEFVEDLEQEITELKWRSSELEQISNTEDHLHLLQNYSSLCTPPPTNNWTDVRIQPHLDVKTLRRALSQLQECVDEGMKKAINIELKRIQQYAVDVILDPDTAHNYLILSCKGKQVTCGDKRQNLPDYPERFDYSPCVLGKKGFSSGRFYFEVQVKGKTWWELGVTRESSNRKGEITACSENGYWSVSLICETFYVAQNSPHVPLSLKHAPQKVGVFVDYEEGLVSFYDVENESHIYSFTGQAFSGKLYPYFNPCFNDGGKNSAPLIICPLGQVQSKFVKIVKNWCLPLFISFLLCFTYLHFCRYQH